MFIPYTILAALIALAVFVGFAIGMQVQYVRNRRFQIWKRFQEAEVKFKACGVGEV